MDPRNESIKVHCLIHIAKRLITCRVDTLNKMKTELPSLEKYADSSCAEETFFEIYHWTFTYLKENEMCKVVDVEVPPSLARKSPPQTQKKKVLSSRY